MVTGSCRTVIIAGKLDRCTNIAQVKYSLLDNGRAMLAFVVGGGRVIAFVSEKDAQPQPQTYYMYLSRVRIARLGSDFAANVGGQCLITISPDKTVWSTISCKAIDEDGAA